MSFSPFGQNNSWVSLCVPIITIRKEHGSNNQVSYNDFNKIDLTTIYYMDWSSNSCNYLPLTCLNFNNLQQFYCANNKLKLVPNMNFPNLKIFNCSFNQITILPDNIVNCSNLIELTCFDNKLKVLPNMSFKNLQILSCFCNELTTLPTEMYLPELLELKCFSNQLLTLPDDMKCIKLKTLNCFDNKLQSLPTNMNFPNLQELICSRNQITTLSNLLNFPNLIIFDCSNNQIKSLPNNMNFPNLKRFDCANNHLKLLHNNMNFPNLEMFDCANNHLKLLPNNMNFPFLERFDCANNHLKSLPNNMYFPNLERFNCSNNQLESLPACILNFLNLQTFRYANNRIELSVQFARFIDRINNRENNLINVYNDGQNVHNSTIQLTVRESINQITLRTDVPKYNIEQLSNLIIENNILTETTKSLLFEYCNDLSVHSLLLLTFSEVLWFIIQTIITDFQINEQEEIFKILNQEIIDTECKCFSGRMCRVINCLNGFSPLVNININDGEQIGNIIVLVKNKLESSDDYTIEKHKLEVQNELLERGYDIETINLWLEHIE